MSFDNKAIWAIIPARGGSKGIPRKNIVNIAGRPLLSYTIDQALASKYLDGVSVSTEDDEIKEVSRLYGASIIDRPSSLAKDESSTIDVLKHALLFLDEHLDFKIEQIVLLQPTTPLRRDKDIDNAIELFFSQGADSVVSVIKAPHSYNPYWAKKIINGRLKLMFEDGVHVTRRQDLTEVFWHNGQIYIITRDHLFRYGDWYKGKCLPYICPEETFLNIDQEGELRLAEDMIYSQREKRVEKISLDLLDKKIGYPHSCFIIAEGGVNHNGDMDLAKGLIDAAAEAGVDAIKFQFFDPKNVTTSFAPMAEYQKINLGVDKSQQEMLSELSLLESDLVWLKQYAEQRGLIFLCTSHSGVKEYAKLEEMGVCAHKVGSGDLLNLPVLKYLAGRKKPIILGTGMSTMEEIKAAYRFLVENGNDKSVFLHCTTDYPCKPNDVNMKAMLAMKSELECPVGYSDHTLGIEVAIMAVSLGACVLEKHLTLDRSLPGPDHKASVVPEEIKAMVAKIRNIESARGHSVKEPAPSEEETLKIARKSLVYYRDLKEGSVIAEGDIAVKRPGTGISPLHYYEMIGRRLGRSVVKDRLVSEEDFEELKT